MYLPNFPLRQVNNARDAFLFMPDNCKVAGICGGSEDQRELVRDFVSLPRHQAHCSYEECNLLSSGRDRLCLVL